MKGKTMSSQNRTHMVCNNIPLAEPCELSPDETQRVSGGAHHKNDVPVGPASYNVHSSPAGAGPAFYNM